MDSTFTKFIIENSIGDYASIVGVLISLFGFIITIINVIKSKKTVEQTNTIAKRVREDLIKTDIVMEFSSLLSELEEVKRLHRKNAWEILPDRYSSLRKKLYNIKNSYSNFEGEQLVTIQIAIQSLQNIEEKVDKAVFLGKEPDEVYKLNKSISSQSDKLTEILNDIKSKIGNKDGKE